MKKEKGRLAELDLLRGLAVCGMIVFHAVFILDFYGVVESEMRGGGWEVFGSVVRFLFLGLVGVGMAVSYQRVLGGGGRRDEVLKFDSKKNEHDLGMVGNGCSVKGGFLNSGLASAAPGWRAIRWQWRRAILVFGSGIVVSGVTAVFLPEDYVRFGILHLIGLSIFVLSFLVWNKWLCLVVGVVAFWLRHGVGVNVLPGDFALGVDYFPVFPWMGVVALGIWLGHFLYAGGRPKYVLGGAFQSIFKSRLLKPVFFAGRNSLAVYLLHVPAIVLLFLVFGLLQGNVFR